MVLERLNANKILLAEQEGQVYPGYAAYNFYSPGHGIRVDQNADYDTIEIEGTDLIWSPMKIDDDADNIYQYALNDGDKSGDWIVSGYYPVYHMGPNIRNFPFNKIHFRKTIAAPSHYLNLRFYVFNDPRVYWELERIQNGDATA